MHTLQKLLQGIAVQQLIGDPHVPVQAICYDSRLVDKHSLFVAVKGTQVDGHAYIQQAIAAGSKAIVCEHLPAETVAGISYVQVMHSAKALGLLAANFYDHPAKKLRLVGVTGTSGKTSTVHLLHGLFKELGYAVGMLSTIHNKIQAATLPALLTTPDALEINRLLALMVERGCQYCFMEASSHAIVQERMAGLHWTGAAFTNISHDHLDYHQTFDAYIWAKKKLFDDLPTSAFALYNADDRRGKVMMQNTSASIHSFAMKSPADFTAKLLANTQQGLCLRIENKEAWFQLLGEFNADNILAAYAMGCLLGQDSDQVLVALSAVSPIAGRLQYIQAPEQFGVIVDYAHKPDALEKVLIAINQMKLKQGKVITVVGCGGNRDTKKRPMMAQIAVKYSDQVIFTSDNPRNEDADAIVQDMMAGLTVSQQKKVLPIVDRKSAIKTACQFAKPNDMVLIAGKGHETYQEIKGQKFPFDDVSVVQAIIAVD